MSLFRRNSDWFKLAKRMYNIFTTLPYSIHYVIQYTKEFKIHSVETLSGVSKKSSVKIVTFVKRET